MHLSSIYRSLSRIVVFVALALLLTNVANARPEYALLRGDASCLGCHVNPTGGELRSAGGESFEINQLPMWNRGDKFSASVKDNFRVGIDFRSQYISYIDAITPPRDSSGVVNSKTATILKTYQAMALPIYLSAQLTKSLGFFGRYDLLYGQSEAWGLLHFVHQSGEILQAGDVVGDAYIKVGAFEPAFGIRFDDHTVYTRGGDGQLINGLVPTGLIWQPEYRDVGVELGGLFFDHLSVTGGVFDAAPGQPLGTDTSSKFAFAARVQYSTEIIEDMLSLEIGGSYYTHAHTAQQNSAGPTITTSLEAVHGGFRAGPITVMAEADFTKNLPVFAFTPATTPTKANAFLCEAIIQIVKGLRGYLRFDNYHDFTADGIAYTTVTGRYSVGFEWYPIRFLEIRPELRIAKLTIPDAVLSGIDNHTETSFFVQSHVFF